MKEDPTLVNVRQLSSGTIATLTGNPSYANIEETQAAFVAYVADNPHKFNTWIAAWEEFWKDYKTPYVIVLVQEGKTDTIEQVIGPFDTFNKAFAHSGVLLSKRPICYTIVPLRRP